MKHTKNRSWKKKSGFTLVELLIVVVILGVLAAMTFGTFSSQATSTAVAQQYYNLANQGTRAWKQMITVAGAPRQLTSNPVFNGTNSLLDMLVAGDIAITANYQNAYRRSGLAPSEEMVQVETYPTATVAGAYKLGTVDVTVVDAAAADGTLNWEFDGVTPEVVLALVEKLEPALADTYSIGDAITAGSANRLVAADAGNGLMDLTLITKTQ